MGESVAEATLTTWLKEVGDTIEMDDPVFEIATDKVDSEVPSEVEGILIEKRFDIDDIIKVGDTVAIIEIDGASNGTETESSGQGISEEVVTAVEKTVVIAKETTVAPIDSSSERFYSPLVKNIARQEGISMDTLDNIVGTGKGGRVTKNDILGFIANGKSVAPAIEPSEQTDRNAVVSETDKPTRMASAAIVENKKAATPEAATTPSSSSDEIIEMTRMGKLIAKHMVESVSTSAHVQSFIEVDVTNVVNWRSKMKDTFERMEGEKLTFTPIFMEAVAKALKKYPMMNISVDGDTVIKKKNINIGMAAALPDGNLIVPVIKNADRLNLVGMAKVVNDLANRARQNQLKPDEIQEGTYTVTNVGTFGSVFGTPIINQPQVGILALGAIRKVPAVIETAEGDFIGIRSKMYISHSYDHRVVNGALGSMFAKAVADYLEAWDMDREL